MRIHNIRMGFASNSSSSHSLVIFDEGNLPPDAPQNYEFGWDFFTASSERTKLVYLAILLREELARQEFDRPTAKLVIAGLCGEEIAEIAMRETEGYLEGWVDHQSRIEILRPWNKVGVDMDWWEELKATFINPSLAILGGNDNDCTDHPELAHAIAGYNVPTELGTLVGRKDSDGYWTMFNRERGTKIRFSFQDAEPNERSDVPDLVDVKITDFCPYNCQYCYQGSSETGPHAKLAHINDIILALSQLKTFEVAIGGGEPLLHPDFLNILQNFRRSGIIPNFTTRNLDWLRDPRIWQPAMEYCGSFAVSVSSRKEVMKLLGLMEANNISRAPGSPEGKLTLNIVDGLTSQQEMLHILGLAYQEAIPVTLLGYKATGRATGQHRKYKNAGLWERIAELRKKHRCPQLSVDTVFASEYEEEIVQSNIHPTLFHTSDGITSCYIDAINMTIAISSYQTKSAVPLIYDRRNTGELSTSIRRAWQGLSFS